MNTGIMDYGRQLFGFGTSQETKYHGLLNQGATCYLNSVLQVLFMTKDFREAVERHNPENPDTEFIDCDLKALFDDLKVRSAYTYSITKKLRIDRVYEQRDAAEYFEKILRLTSPEVSQIFHGQLTHRTICSACDKVTDANGPFWHLPLALVDSYKGHYSVARGIEEFFKASNICGGNQLYCEQCDAKADATVKSVLTHHPEVLMLLLKRFEFDYQYMAYVKRNCVVDVPYILHIPENQTYELYAFVEHSGDLRSGHYTATVKSQDDDRWYKFNDTSVTLLNSQPYQVDSSEKSRTAYLLFYRKKTTHVADSCTPELRDGGFPPAISDNYVQCQGVEKISERGEDEEAAKKTGLRDMVCVGRGPHLICSVDDQDNKDDVRQRIPDNEDKRGLLPTETQPKERGEDQIYDAAGMDDVRQRTPDINHDFKPRAGDSHARHDHLSKQGDMSNEQRRQMVDMTDMEAQQSNRVAKHQDHEGSGDVRRIHEHEGGKQEVRQHYDPQLGSLGKKGDEERVGVDVKNDEEGKTVEHKRGDYEDAQRKGTSRTKPCISKDLENEDKRRSGDVRQNRPDQKISVTHTTHKHVGVEEQTKEQVYARDSQHIQNREIMLHNERQAGLPGKGRQTEVERAGSVGKMRQDNSQSKDRTKCKKVTGEKRGGSQKSRICHAKIIDEEIKETPHGTQRSSQTKHIRIETLGETSQGDIKSWVRPIKTKAKSKSGQKKDSQDTLSKDVDSLQLNEPKKHKRSLESAEEGNTLMDSNTKRMRTESEQRVDVGSKKKGAGGKIRRAWQRLVQQRQLKKKREKQKRSPQCFSCIPLKKQTGHTSESD